MCWGCISKRNSEVLFLCAAYILVGGEAIKRNCVLKIVIVVRREKVEQGLGEMD